ncbi:MAG: hypothetical protein ISS19_08915 [Bacteroidales bacterium]|nr:hypothetical protein [Bacteroidales bacterium]
MRNLFYWLLVLTSVSCMQSHQSRTDISLIPDKQNQSPDYWCTWGAQNYAIDTQSVLYSLSLGGHSLTAGNLNEENLFGEDGWSSAFPDELKKDLFIVLDLGWDVPSETKIGTENWRLGSLMVVQEKFPSCKGTRLERMVSLNELVTQHHWKGTGLWLPSHPFEDFKDGIPMEDSKVERYYIDAIKLSEAAGIKYWKIDYGYRGGIEPRKRITELAREYYPELIIEHSRGSGPLNDEECPWDTENFHRSGSFRSWDEGAVLEAFVATARISSVLRTYDITQQLSIPTTLDRVAQVLAELSGTGKKVIINCEDEPYLGAVLGCAVGILRHPHMIELENHEYDPFDFKYRVDEVVRTVRWHRLAPAFGAGMSENTLDSVRLNDSWTFREGDGWAVWMNGKTAVQGAPARVSRGMPLPEVTCDGDPPYVLCSRHPNGAVAVAALPRVLETGKISYPLADVSIEITDTGKPVGIFGRYKSLTLVFNEGEQLTSLKLYAQDLAGDKAEDITHLVDINKNRIFIPGDMITTIGLKSATEGDLSEPGMIIQMQ